MRVFTIHKPTHKWFSPEGTPAIATGQLRGSTLVINRLESGQVVDKTRAVESAAHHLTGYGKGVSADDPRAVKDMQSAWLYVFGPDVPPPTWCEIHVDPVPHVSGRYGKYKAPKNANGSRGRYFAEYLRRALGDN